ncbi:MAG: hypothetical protein DRP87_19740 [Spirochaetes bacterium]|nr:MAG: hypothetical protein DRP87_19740 [Spirochaetota bacterium]
MTKGQNKLADYILENTEEVSFLTSSELGKKAGVSEATVIRFAQFLGFTGYPEFKENLQHLIKERITPRIKMKETVERIKNKEDVFNNLIHIDRAMLERLMEENSPEGNIRQAVNLLHKGKKIFLVGLGISKAVVDFLEFRLYRLKYNVTAITAGGDEIINKMLGIRSEDVVLGIGFFRPHREIIVAFDIARNNGASIIAITDSDTSPLALKANVVLQAKRGPSEIMTSLVAPMSIANILVLSLAMEEKEDSIKAFNELDHLKEKYNL